MIQYCSAECSLYVTAVKYPYTVTVPSQIKINNGLQWNSAIVWLFLRKEFEMNYAKVLPKKQANNANEKNAILII